MSATTEVESPYLNSKQAARYCNCSIHTLRNRAREIQRVAGIGRLMFTREALDRWMNTPRKKANRRRPARAKAK